MWREDPEWLRARSDYVDDARGSETPTDVMCRRMFAAVRMGAIEAAIEAGGTHGSEG